MRINIIAILLFPLFLCSQSGPDEDLWEPLRFFVGRWEGNETGKSGYGKGEREYQFILNGQYLYLENRSVFQPQEQNPEGEIHEDWTIFSYDRHRKTFIVRQFNSEGYANIFFLDAVASNADTLVFITEKMENFPEGFSARLSYYKQNENEFSEKLEIARPGQDYEQFSYNFWTRAPNSTQ